jgi:hypothetical protein
MKKIKIVFFGLLCLLLVNCNNKNKENKKFNEFAKSNYFDVDRIIENKYKVKYNGDFRAFGEIELYYSYNKEKKEELLPYILIMIEKHKNYNLCPIAFISFYEFYTNKEFNYDGTDEGLLKYLNEFNSLNLGQKNHLKYYLELGVVNNIESCSKYLNLIKKIEKSN